MTDYLESQGSKVFNELKGSVYIGDAVFVSFDGYQIWLKTSNGLAVTNQIALPPDQIKGLFQFVESLRKESDDENK